MIFLNNNPYTNNLATPAVSGVAYNSYGNNGYGNGPNTYPYGYGYNPYLNNGYNSYNSSGYNPYINNAYNQNYGYNSCQPGYSNPYTGNSYPYQDYYNTGYGLYNAYNMNNPYLYQQQLEAQRQQELKSQQQQFDIIKRLCHVSAAYYNIEVDENYLNMTYTTEVNADPKYAEFLNDYQEYQSMVQLDRNFQAFKQSGQPYYSRRYLNICNNMEQVHQRYAPYKDMDLDEFFDNSRDLIIAMKQDKSREIEYQRRGGDGKFLGKKEYFNTSTLDVHNRWVEDMSIDDLSVNNGYINQGYKEMMDRKERFLKSILNEKARNNGISLNPQTGMIDVKLPDHLKAERAAAEAALRKLETGGGLFNDDQPRTGSQNALPPSETG